MITMCGWCPKDAPPMHDDGKGTLITTGICQQHLFEMRALLKEVPRADDVSAGADALAESPRD